MKKTKKVTIKENELRCPICDKIKPQEFGCEFFSFSSEEKEKFLVCSLCSEYLRQVESIQGWRPMISEELERLNLFVEFGKRNIAADESK